MKQTKRNVKKVVKKSRKTHKNPRKFFAKPSVPRGFQVYNAQKLMKIHTFKETQAINDIVGTGGIIQSINSFNVASLFRYSNLISLYKQYRINYIKIRVRLNNVELTDNAIIPTFYTRFLYDPQLIATWLTEQTVQKFSNVIVKQLQNGAGQTGNLLEYKVKPAVLEVVKVYGSNNSTFKPKFNQWCDFQSGLGSAAGPEIDHWGYFYFIDNLPVGMTVSVDQEISISCRDMY